MRSFSVQNDDSNNPDKNNHNNDDNTNYLVLHKCISQSQLQKDKYNSGLLFTFILCHPLKNIPVFCI